MKESYRINDFRGLEEEIKSKGRERERDEGWITYNKGRG